MHSTGSDWNENLRVEDSAVPGKYHLTNEPRTTGLPEGRQRWIVAQRWYGDKSRTILRASQDLIGECDLDGIRCHLLQVHLEFADSGTSTYFVPVVSRDEGKSVDAFTEPRFLQWLGVGFDQGRSLEVPFSGGARLTWSRPLADSHAAWSANSPRVLEGEQSNTSVRFGDAAIVKIFRKVQPGINPDSEIVSFLTEQGQFSQIPTFMGSIQLSFDDGRESIEFAAAQAFVPNRSDCWKWLLVALRVASDTELDGLLQAMALLGRRTAGMHAAFAGGDSEAFRPRQFDCDAVDALVERLGREVRQTTSTLHSDGTLSHVESDNLAASLLARVSDAGVLLGTLQTRVHGDYHLGQVLRSDSDFVIIDFEGEPSRSMPERRQKQSPLKDVAGMVRSLDYAVAAASQSSTNERVTALRIWGRQAEQAYLDGYFPVIRRPDRSIVPDDPPAFRRALNVFIVEKALYEVRYELDNRPDWLDIPLDALKRLTSGN